MAASPYWLVASRSWLKDLRTTSAGASDSTRSKTRSSKETQAPKETRAPKEKLGSKQTMRAFEETQNLEGTDDIQGCEDYSYSRHQSITSNGLVTEELMFLLLMRNIWLLSNRNSSFKGDSCIVRAQIDKRLNASGHKRINSALGTYSYLDLSVPTCHMLVDGLDELVPSHILSSGKISKLESSIYSFLARKSLEACVGKHLIDQWQWSYATESAVELKRVEDQNVGGSRTTWIISVDRFSLSHAGKTQDREWPLRLLPFTAKGHEIYQVGILLLEAAMENTDWMRPPTEHNTAKAPDRTSSDHPTHMPAFRRSGNHSPGSETGGGNPAPNDLSTDLLQNDRATVSKTARPGLQSPSQENVLGRRMEEILVDWENRHENDVSNSGSDDILDINAESPFASEASDDSQAEYSGEMCFTRHGNAPPSGPSNSSAIHCGGMGETSQTSGNSSLGRESQATQTTEDSQSMCLGEGLIVDGDERKAKVIPCPIEDCPGKESSISELLRKLQNLQHNKFICRTCWRDLRSLEGLQTHTHTPCEKHCVLKTCNPNDAQDVRHKYGRLCCVDKCEAGSTLEARKEDEYQYLCGLLGVTPRPLEEGVKTRHKGQRKPPSKTEAVARDAIDQAIAATGLNEILKIENQELLRQTEELKTAALMHDTHTRELVQILQQTLEEYDSRSLLISKALYRRIEHQAPSVLEDLPHGINPHANPALRTQNSASVSAVDQVTGPSSSSHAPDRLKRESRVTYGSNDTPSKRQRLASPSAASCAGATTTLTERSVPATKGLDQHAESPCFGATIGQPRSQHQHRPNSAQNMSAQSLSHPSDYHEIPPALPTSSLAHAPAHFHQGHLPEFPKLPTPPQPGNYDSATPSVQQYNRAIDYGSGAMNFSFDQDPDDMSHLQGSNNWDACDFSSLLNASPHSGGVFDDTFSFDFSMD